MTKTFNEMTRAERIAKLHQIAIQAIEKHGLFIQGVGGDEERNLSPYAYSNGISWNKETPYEFLLIGSHQIFNLVNECFELSSLEENKDYESKIFRTVKDENVSSKFNLFKIEDKDLIKELKAKKLLAWISYDCNPEYVWVIEISDENNKTHLELGITKEEVISKIKKEI